jgi:hypothetical protein
VRYVDLVGKWKQYEVHGLVSGLEDIHQHPVRWYACHRCDGGVYPAFDADDPHCTLCVHIESDSNTLNCKHKIYHTLLKKAVEEDDDDLYARVYQQSKVELGYHLFRHKT